MSTDKVTIGRIVHYGIGVDHEGKVIRRPAIVVNDWSRPTSGTCIYPNLQVHLDGSNDILYRERAEAEYVAFVAAHPGVNSGETIGDASDLRRFCDLSNARTHGPNDAECERGLMWRTSVNCGEGVGEWCWPPRVENARG